MSVSKICNDCVHYPICEWCSENTDFTFPMDAGECVMQDTASNERWLEEVARLNAEIVKIKADTIRKMQTRIKEECLKGGIYPAFVAGVIRRVAKELLEERE